MRKFRDMILRKRIAQLRGHVLLRTRQQGMCNLSVGFSEPYEVSSIHAQAQVEIKAFQTIGTFTIMGKDKKDLIVEVWEADRPTFASQFRRQRIAILKASREASEEAPKRDQSV